MQRCYRSVFRFAALLIVFGCLTSLAVAQDGGDTTMPSLPPVSRTYAITNARVVVSPGTVLDHATVVVHDGLIVGVGRAVTVPADAFVIDGDSLVVYAGFIDGMSHGGVPAEDPPSGTVKRPGDPPDERAGIRPERDVLTLLDAHHPSVDSLRRAGFTVAQVVPRGQMLPGIGALVSLGGEDAEGMVLRAQSSTFARFEPAVGDVYPVTPMGIIAKWRQLYHRASDRLDAERKYRQDPTGRTGPTYDHALEAFAPVVDGSRPVLFQTPSALEARRAVALAHELGFRLAIAGLREPWEITRMLDTAGAPVFLSLNFPEPADANADSAATVEATDSVHRRLRERQQSERQRYWSAAAGLARSGRHFGFSTDDAPLGDVRANLVLAVESGLDRERALAALTTDAAAALGLQRSHGMVRPGMAADLVVTDGDYFDRRSKVRYVFVNGTEYDYPDGAAPVDSVSPIRYLDGSIASETDSITDKPLRGSILVRNATVLTVTHGRLEHTDVLVRDGKITAIGQNLAAPSGVRVVDATGEYLMPGIIDAHSHIAVSGAVNEWTNPVTSEVAIGDVLDPFDISLYRALAGGVTVSQILHGSANVIGGQCQTIKHRYGVTDPELLKFQGAPRSIKFALGENPTRVHGRGFGVPPSTRMGVEDVMRRALTEARRYRLQQQQAARDGTPPPQYSLRLETLAQVLEGKLIVNCHSYRSDELLMVMRVFRDFGIHRLLLQHVNEGFKVAPEIAAFGAYASVFSDFWAYKFEVYYSTAYNADILTRNGVVTSINSDSPDLDRYLYHEAAKAMHYGDLSPDEALAMITINPARQIGVDDRVGSIEIGKDGDLALFTADPLSIYAICRMTVVDGVVRFDRDHDPDDMRIHVDMKHPVTAATIDGHERDACMEGTEDLWDYLR